jgi:L-glutamine-phosphate cytidylyltransferase
MQNKNLKVILLVAGEGKRLRPYTEDRPKCLVEVDGQSLISRQLEVLKSQGLNDFIMIGGYKSIMLEKFNTKLILNPRFFETNMVWSLFCGETELEGDLIISYGDIVYSKEILEALLKSKKDISVTIDKNWLSYWESRNEDPLDDAETLKLRNDGTISEIGLKPESLDNIEGQYMGLMKFSNKGIRQLKEVFHKIKKNKILNNKVIENLYMTDLLQELIYSGFSIHSVPISDSWVEVDTVEDLNSKTTSERLMHIKKNL